MREQGGPAAAEPPDKPEVSQRQQRHWDRGFPGRGEWQVSGESDRTWTHVPMEKASFPRTWLVLPVRLICTFSLSQNETSKSAERSEAHTLHLHMLGYPVPGLLGEEWPGENL